MRMAEVKAAPPLSAASENPPSNEVTQNSKPKSSGGGGVAVAAAGVETGVAETEVVMEAETEVAMVKPEIAMTMIELIVLDAVPVEKSQN